MHLSPDHPFPSPKTLAYGLLPLLFTLLCTCGRAPKPSLPTEVVGSIRYEEKTQLLTADLAISPHTSAIGPTLFSTAMPAFPAGGPGHYRGRRNLPFPDPIRLSVPCGNTAPPCDLTLPFSPPFADSLPPTGQTGAPLRFIAGKNALLENENLVFFFEPADRSDPKRILLQGPTASGRVNLPKESLSDLKPGKYEVYFIKQQLHKDSITNLQTSIQTEYFTRSMPFEMMNGVNE